MATPPEFEPFFIDSQERSELTTLMVLGSLLNRMNEVYEYHGLHDQIMHWDHSSHLYLKTFPHSQALQLKVRELEKAHDTSRDIGYFNPAEGSYRIYPEFMEDECDLGLLKSIAGQKREEIINQYDKGADPTPRTDYSHQMVVYLHRYHNDTLIGRGIAGEILYQYNSAYPISSAHRRIEIDEVSHAAVFLKHEDGANHNGIEPDYTLGLKILGSYALKNDFKARTTAKSVQLAQRRGDPNVNDGYVPIENDGEPLIEEEQITELLPLINSVRAMRATFPSFSTTELGIALKPGQTPVENELTADH